MTKKLATLLTLLTSVLFSFAQAPSGVPYGQPDELELDLTNIIVFIVLPLLLIAFFIWFRISKKRKK